MRIILGLSFLLLSFTTILAQSQRPEQPDLPGDISIDFGFNQLMQHPEQMNLRFFRSRSFGIYYQKIWQLSDRFAATTNIGVGNDRLGFRRDINFQLDTGRTFSFDTLQLGNIKKNLLTQTYLEIPLELRFYPTKTNDRGEGFFIGVGGVFGYRVDSHTKIKYSANGENRILKDKARLGHNNIRYGLIGRVGFKSVSLYYKQYFSSLFTDGPLGSDPTVFSFGLTLTGF